MQLFLTIFCIVVAVVLVNWGHRLLMKALGADMILFNMKSKLFAYGVCACFLMYFLGVF